MDGVFVIFVALRRLGFVQKGEGSNCVKARKIGLEFWDGSRVQGACHHVQRGVKRVASIYSRSDIVHDHPKAGLFVDAFSTFGLMYFSFSFDSHLTSSLLP